MRRKNKIGITGILIVLYFLFPNKLPFEELTKASVTSSHKVTTSHRVVNNFVDMEGLDLLESSDTENADPFASPEEIEEVCTFPNENN